MVFAYIAHFVRELQVVADEVVEMNGVDAVTYVFAVGFYAYVLLLHGCEAETKYT